MKKPKKIYENLKKQQKNKGNEQNGKGNLC